MKIIKRTSLKNLEKFTQMYNDAVLQYSLCFEKKQIIGQINRENPDCLNV